MFKRFGILLLAVPFMLIIICLWIWIGWYFTIAVAIVAVIALLYFFWGRVPGRSFIRSFRILPSISGDLFRYMFLGFIFVGAILFLWNTFVREAEKWPWETTRDTKQAIVTTPATPVVSIATNTLDVNTPQLLQKGVVYEWNRKCATIYYFEPTQISTAKLKYAYKSNTNLYRTTEIFRDENGPGFTSISGSDPLIEGMFLVVVDRDIEVTVRTKYVGR